MSATFAIKIMVIITSMTVTNNKKTTISLSIQTKQQIDELAIRKGETYDAILQRIISDVGVQHNQESLDNDVVAEVDEE